MRRSGAGRTWGLVLALVGALGAGTAAQAYDWYTWAGNGHRYAMVDSLAPWDQQEAVAEAEGAHLVTITSQEELNFLFLTFGGYPVWIGLDRDPVGAWQWVTGEPVDFTNWDIDKPNNLRGIENCAQMNYNQSDGTWDDLPAATQSWALIELDAAPGDTTPPTLALKPPKPDQLWPPHLRPVAVTLRGTVRDSESGVARAWIVLTDEYLEYDSVLDVLPLLDARGAFKLTLSLPAWLGPGDRDGRHYTFVLHATDRAGNEADPVSVGVTVAPPGHRGPGGKD